MPRQPFAILATTAAALLATAPAEGQAPRMRQLPLIGSEVDDIDRLAVIAGADSVRPQTLRAPSRLMPADSTDWSAAVLVPEVFLGYNSALSYGFNDGALWQGRGTNLRLTAGFVLEHSLLRVIVAPQLISSRNLPYQVVPYFAASGPARSQWANPFHPHPVGIDLPLRQGASSITSVGPGQSSITLTSHGLQAGVATENVWWGPGMQNAILLSANAAGVPAAFVRTARPVATRTGTWDAWWMVGQLSESDFFDSDATNDARSLAGAAVTWRPPHTTGVELGLGRIVIAAGRPSLGSVMHPLQSVGRPNGADSLDGGTRDQVTSLWARWAQPRSGFEAWGEVARFEEPASIRDLLEYPGHSQGYTLGLQWTRPVGVSRVRLWAEGTYLEPSPSIRVRHVEATYVSRPVPQGFTNRGQALGAGIGPGASSQWLAGDWFHEQWHAGGFLSRVRWDNAALFTPVVPQVRREDVSLIGGLRAGRRWNGLQVTAAWARSVRLNYLFQAYLVDAPTGRTEGIDIVNNALTLTFAGAPRWIQ